MPPNKDIQARALTRIMTEERDNLNNQTAQMVQNVEKMLGNVTMFTDQYTKILPEHFTFGVETHTDIVTLQMLKSMRNHMESTITAVDKLIHDLDGDLSEPCVPTEKH